MTAQIAESVQSAIFLIKYSIDIRIRYTIKRPLYPQLKGKEINHAITYEWTSNTGGNNLHRVVIFRDNTSRAGQEEPFTTLKPLGSDNPRDLCKWMNDYAKKIAGQVLAIAHNGYLSNGIMFPIVESFTGKQVDLEYARTRAKWEPL